MAKFKLLGDKFQLRSQIETLKSMGLEVVDGTLITAEDFLAALKIIWLFETSGFWFYKELLIKHGICTETEFQATIDSLGIEKIKKIAIEIKRAAQPLRWDHLWDFENVGLYV